MVPDPSLELVSGPVPRGDGEDLGFGIVDVDLQLLAIEHKHRFKGGMPDPLVAVDERVIRNQGEAERGGFLDETRVEIVAPEGLLRLAESRFQHAEIPETVGPTGQRDDSIVEVEDLSQAEVADHRSRS